MKEPTMRDFLICYDICNPARLARIHRKLKSWAVPIQYSVFLYSGHPRTLSEHHKIQEQMIDPKEDDQRRYPRPARGLRPRMGPATFPDGIIYTPMPARQGFLVS